MRIAIIALEGSLLSPIAGLADMIWITNQALRAPPTGRTPCAHQGSEVQLEAVIVSANGQSVRDHQGRMIPVDGAFKDVSRCDAVLIAGMALGNDGLPPHSDPVIQAAGWLSTCYREGALIGGACAGTFVLGEAGLLNGRRCSTTWWLHHAFKKRFPLANPIWGTAVEEQDRIVTTGGPLSWIDLALHVIRRLAGDDVATLAADISVADSQPLPQLIYAPRGFVNTADPLLLQAEQIIRHAKPGLTAEALAQTLNMSKRTLHRRLKDLTNESPKEFINRVRIETACMMLDTPGTSVKEVSAQCGYGDETSFRRSFTQLTGKTPADYKRWSNGRRSGAIVSAGPHESQN